MTQPYTTAELLMDAVDKQVDDSNGRITRLILDVSEAIDRICNRPDGFLAGDTATARTFPGSGSGVLRIDDAVEITAVGVKENASDTSFTTWDADTYLGFSGDERFPDFNHTPYSGIMAAYGSGSIFTSPWGSDDIAWASSRWNGFSRLSRRGPAPPTVRISARWGFADEVPGPVEEACIIQASRMWKRARSAYADTLVGGEMGNLLFRVQMDNDLKLMLEKARLIRVPVG